MSFIARLDLLSTPCGATLRYLEVENNNKFVRGRKRAREDIEQFVLARYKARKRHKDGNEYILHIPYETDEELDEIVHGILSEAESYADMRHCFIEADARSLDDPNKYW